jgi:predicted O-methyltransferase YrrM
MVQKTDFLTLVRNTLRPGFAPEMFRKLRSRLSCVSHAGESHAATAWAIANASSVEDFARHLDPKLWQEAEAFSGTLDAHANETLARIPYDLGGGGDYRLLYFLVRYLRPGTVVETGVAAGFSSTAILEALEKNHFGRLLSSDFPYFRIPDPAKYVGVVVPHHLHSRWTLFTKGDRVNVPRIVEAVKEIDLFHYDSDKTDEGRSFALDAVRRKLSENAVLIFDDIQDNRHFQRLVESSDCKYRVFFCRGKWLGLIGI